MSRSVRPPRRGSWRTALAVTAATLLAVSGCASGQVSQTANQVPAIDGATGVIGEITVLNARFAATEAEGYSEGSDGRILLWISNESLTVDDTLTSVSSAAVEEIVIRGDAMVPAQYLADFSSASGPRVTANGFTQELPYGVSVPVTFSFENAGDITLNLPIEIPEEREGERPTIEILPPHPTPIWEEGHGEENAEAGAEGAEASDAAATGEGGEG